MCVRVCFPALCLSFSRHVCLLNHSLQRLRWSRSCQMTLQNISNSVVAFPTIQALLSVRSKSQNTHRLPDTPKRAQACSCFAHVRLGTVSSHNNADSESTAKSRNGPRRVCNLHHPRKTSNSNKRNTTKHSAASQLRTCVYLHMPPMPSLSAQV